MELFVGIDLHKKFFTYFASDTQGTELCHGRYENTLENIAAFLAQFPTAPKVVVEAMGSWMWFIRELRHAGCEVVLAHPLKVRAIASSMIKTDKVDAQTLCHLLRSNMIPSSYIASEAEQENRELARGRISLVHDKTQLKNRTIAILIKENLKFTGSDVFGAKGRAWIAALPLSEEKRYMVDVFLQKIDGLEKTIADIDVRIKAKSSSIPEVCLLESIPGIGKTTAFLLASEIGDVTRFPTSKKFASYFGLVPRLHQSGSHAYYGRITKLGNPFVRWALLQSAQRLARYDEQSKRFITRIAFRSGKKKALVALSRELATVIYCVLKENRPYIKEFKRSPMVSPAVVT